MPLVNAKCTNCGANLRVDDAKDAAICEFCGAAFIVEKAINNFTITNNIQAGVVNIYGSAGNDFDIRGGVLVKYNGTSMTPVIPDTVVAIGEKAFEGSMITEVTIPDSIEEIRYGAFAGCARLKSVTLPGNITTIRNRTFSNCYALKSVTIPNSVTDIGVSAFENCAGLTQVAIPSSVTNLGGFNGCTGLTQITIPESVTSLGSCAFEGCIGLVQITLPNSLTSINYGAFKECVGLTQITIPSNIASIDRDSFQGCTGLTKVTILDRQNPIIGPSSFSVFAECTNLTDVILPQGANITDYDRLFVLSPAYDILHEILEQAREARAQELKQAYQAEYNAKLAAERRAQGLCIKCGSADFTLFGKCKKCGTRR